MSTNVTQALDPLAMACLKELNSTYEHHLDQIDDPIAKTCEWVTSHNIWNLWDSVPGSALLWITADAGCGKSVAAKYLVDFFQKRTSGAYRHTHVCYLFFKEGLENQDNAHSAVSAVLHQLFSRQHRLMHHAMVKYFSMPKSSFNCFSTLWSILLATMEDPHTKGVVWILDGLDECEEKSLDELIKALADFVQSRKTVPMKARPTCKIVLLSRPLNSIERRLRLRSGNGNHNVDPRYNEDCDSFRLSGEEESVSVAKDIAHFVVSKISDLGQQSELSTDILSRLEKRLISRADYTFLWVSLVMNIVKEAEVDGISMDQIETILATTKLEDVYEKLLSGRASPLKTRKVLLLILAAVRPLTLDELCAAVEVNQDYHETGEAKRALAQLKDKKPELRASQEFEIAETASVLSPVSSSSALEPRKKKTKRRAATRSGRNIASTNLTHKLKNDERRGMRTIHRRLEAHHDRFSLQPGMKTSTVSDLQELQNYIHKPFINHLRQVCGHFVRIRNQKIYLVHQTARQFLLDKHRDLDIRTTSQRQRHSLPIDQDKQEPRTSKFVSQWQRSISLADANLYMLQICVDYINLFQSVKVFKTALNREEAGVYLKKCRKDPLRAFLRYVSCHWLDHYRPVRQDLKLCYDYLLRRNTPQFNTWTISHDSWIAEEQRKVLEVGGVPIVKEEEEEAGHGKVGLHLPTTKPGPWRRKQEDSEQLYFNLIGKEIDLYDEEYIHGKRYWKGKDYIESGDASTGPSDEEGEEVEQDSREPNATVPDRMQYYRQQQSKRVMEIIEEGRGATSASMANPTSSRSWLA